MAAFEAGSTSRANTIAANASSPRTSNLSPGVGGFRQDLPEHLAL
ncbi:hypothetical protein [Arthrobacter sp. StoSoilB5]|nr:hypothetical protein [Arthrobacter sp. StoSoilB5]